MIKIEKLFSKKAWVESNAIIQLEQVSKLTGVVRVVALPDLHLGKGNAVGSTVLTEEVIYPTLIGGDIGCGLAAFKINIKKFKKEKLYKELVGIEEENLNIGAGNHFVEILKDKDNELLILVHCGSRRKGEEIYREFTKTNGNKGIKGSDLREFLCQHDEAVNWAKEHRRKIAQIVGETLGSKEVKEITNAPHNLIVETSKGFHHHKGSTFAKEKEIIAVAGTRGTASYLVEAKGDGEINLNSVSHGAGRKWNRSDASSRIKNKFRKGELLQTKVGSLVICTDTRLLMEEAPECYKDIEQVIEDLETFNLIENKRKLIPLVTFKTNKALKHK